MQLHPYQFELESKIYGAWEIVRNVLAVLATGGGKTVIFSDIISKHNGASCVVAHRQELVSQISLALARFGIRHKVIGSADLIAEIVQLHMSELGRHYVDSNSRCAVAGVLTLLSRKEQLHAWMQQVTLWVMDEAHHVLAENTWGKAVALFPNAKGLGVTANTRRADGKGLGRHADGVMDTLVEGVAMRGIINLGFLTDYRVFAPPSDLNLEGVSISTKTGDFSKPQVKKRIASSHIVGDVVEHYLKYAPGKLGITFADSIDTAKEINAKFNGAGVPSEIITSKTKIRIRQQILKRFRRREILQLVNVDLFGEGFDLPAIEVVSMARPTASFNLFCQQFGRALRILDGKLVAMLIDHVGNVKRHGLPDAKQVWTLDRRSTGVKGKKDPDMIPVKRCAECTSLYEAIYPACPYCGDIPIPASRSGPEYVDGDLTELNAEVLAAMRGEVERVDESVGALAARLQRANAPGAMIAGVTARHVNRQTAQKDLREAISWWAGYQRALNRPDSESYKRFYFAFGVDVLNAKALGRREAEALTENVYQHLERATNA